VTTERAVRRGHVELHDLVRHEWWDDHMLSRRSLIWIDEHAEPGDPIPVITAIAQLRAEGPPSMRPASSLE